MCSLFRLASLSNTHLGLLHVFLWLNSSCFKAVNNIPLSGWTTVYPSPTGRNCPWKQLLIFCHLLSNVKEVGCVSLKGTSNSDSDQKAQVHSHPVVEFRRHSGCHSHRAGPSEPLFSSSKTTSRCERSVLSQERCGSLGLRRRGIQSGASDRA